MSDRTLSACKASSASKTLNQIEPVAGMAPVRGAWGVEARGAIGAMAEDQGRGICMTLATPGVLSDGVSVEPYLYSANFAGVIGSDGP